MDVMAKPAFNNSGSPEKSDQEHNNDGLKNPNDGNHGSKNLFHEKSKGASEKQNQDNHKYNQTNKSKKSNGSNKNDSKSKEHGKNKADKSQESQKSNESLELTRDYTKKHFDNSKTKESNKNSNSGSKENGKGKTRNPKKSSESSENREPSTRYRRVYGTSTPNGYRTSIKAIENDEVTYQTSTSRETTSSYLSTSNVFSSRSNEETTTLPATIHQEWSTWSSFSCNDTCGMCGFMVAKRYCISLDFGCPCTGPRTMTNGERCADSCCPFPRSVCCPGYVREVDYETKTFSCVTPSKKSAITSKSP